MKLLGVPENIPLGLWPPLLPGGQQLKEEDGDSLWYLVFYVFYVFYV